HILLCKLSTMALLVL
nr:immunoglobulin heavy chain junction region [Mus musculus]